MTQEPLWASSLATPPRPDEDEHLDEPQAPREPGRPDALPPEPPAPVSYRRLLPVVLVAAVVGIAVSLAANHGGPLDVKTVDSKWGNTAMRCDTVRFETPRPFGSGTRAIEIFECRASGNGVLPNGDYRSPRWTWDSDIDERQAIANRMVIRDGVVRGWARY